jgi:hypothetical protein
VPPHSRVCGCAAFLFGYATLRLCLRYLGSYHRECRAALPHHHRLRSLIFYSPAAGKVSLGWLTACKPIFYFIACGGQGRFLQQAVTNRVGRGLQPRCSSPSLVYGLQAADPLPMRARSSSSTIALCAREKLAYALFATFLRVA